MWTRCCGQCASPSSGRYSRSGPGRIFASRLLDRRVAHTAVHFPHYPIEREDGVASDSTSVPDGVSPRVVSRAERRRHSHEAFVFKDVQLSVDLRPVETGRGDQLFVGSERAGSRRLVFGEVA